MRINNDTEKKNVNKFSQALIRESCMYTHKPALSLNRFLILNIYLKSYSYLVAISSQHNTNKFKVQYLPYTASTKNISLTTESNKDATT